MAKQTTFKINDRFKNLRKELDQQKEESQQEEKEQPSDTEGILEIIDRFLNLFWI